MFDKIETIFEFFFRLKPKVNSAKASQIDGEDLSTEDNIIALMGPTGTGKSNFIEVVTGMTGLAGHTLQSATKEISIIRLSFPEIVDSDICFVDTPGFDDSKGNDVQTFKAISRFIIDTYKRKLKLTGLLYFHRISDNRMSGSLLKYLDLFGDLCGEDFEKIVFITTMWDEFGQVPGEGHEDELRNKYWSHMIAMGSSVRRFLNERSSAFEVLAPFFEEINRKSYPLLQKEVRDIKSKLLYLQDGQRMSVELDHAISSRQKMLQKIRAELRDPTLEPSEVQNLMEKYEDEVENLTRMAAELEKRGIKTGERFGRVAGRMDWDGAMCVYSPKATTAPKIPLVAQQALVTMNQGGPMDMVGEQGTLDGPREVITTPDGAQVTINQPAWNGNVHSAHSPEDFGYWQQRGTTVMTAGEPMDGPEGATDDVLSELEYPLTGSRFSSEADAEDQPQSISDKSAISPRTFNGDMVEARTPELWKNDDQLSDEDQEEAIDPKEDKPMQEQERRNFVCNSIYTQTSAGDWGRPYGFGSESETWDEFEEWKAEEERREYENWCEKGKTYEEFEMWTTHGHWGEWDGREGGAEDDENDYDDWSLFEQWQENEQWRKFNCLIEQEKHWSSIFKNETDWEGVDHIAY